MVEHKWSHACCYYYHIGSPNSVKSNIKISLYNDLKNLEEHIFWLYFVLPRDLFNCSTNLGIAANILLAFIIIIISGSVIYAIKVSAFHVIRVFIQWSYLSSLSRSYLSRALRSNFGIPLFL